MFCISYIGCKYIILKKIYINVITIYICTWHLVFQHVRNALDTYEYLKQSGVNKHN